MRPFLFYPSITYFAMPMALLAMAVNLTHLQQLSGWRRDVAFPAFGYGLTALFIISAVYFRHFFSRGREALIKEWRHPFQLSFFPLATISWFFASYFVWRYLPDYRWAGEALYDWILGLHGLLNLFLINRWMFDRGMTLDHLRPSWFILLSGDFVAVILGTEMFGHREWMWLYYAVASNMWLVFVALLFYRLIFVKSIEERYRPSLFIFLAPPSLASIAGMKLFGTVWSLPVWGPYGFALTMLLIWLVSGRRFIRNGIGMISWSYIFPLAAFGLASQHLYETTRFEPLLWIALATMGGMVLLAALISGWLMAVAIQNIRSKLA